MYCLEHEDPKFVPCSAPEFACDIEGTYYSILVPAVDTVWNSSIIDICIQKNINIYSLLEKLKLGKSVIIQKNIFSNQEERQLMTKTLNFSAEINSSSTQQTIEADLDKKQGRKVLGAKGNNTLVIFIDDINMPSIEKYRAQPQLSYWDSYFELEDFMIDKISIQNKLKNSYELHAAAPPSCSRASLSLRFTRFFHIFWLPQPSKETMVTIFEAIVLGYINSLQFSDSVRKCGSVVVGCTVDLYK